MQYPQIYISEIPGTLARRRALRTLALDLRARLRPAREPSAVLAVLHLPIEGAGVADLLLARPNTLILAAVRLFDGPVTIDASGWQDQRGQAIREESGLSPLAQVGLQRDTLRARLAETLAAGQPEARAVARLIAAVVCVPTLHPESRIALEIDDHRALRKVLGLDELPGLAAMATSGVRIPDHALHGLVERTGARLWHDGSRLLFELAAPRYHLSLLAPDGAPRMSLPLLEGENILGRRRTARPYEHRLTIAGDDMVSSDHALVICHEDQRVLLRDISKNGTWMTPPGGEESFLHSADRPIEPGTVLRLGETRMRLELVEDER